MNKYPNLLQFNSLVEAVSPQQTSEGMEWEVKVKSITESTTKLWKFDAVIVCNGYVIAVIFNLQVIYYSSPPVKV